MTVNKAVFGKGAGSQRKQAPSAAPIQAMQLLGRWTRLAQGHIAFGGGCNCCGDFGNLQVKDMEQHILDYLDTKYRAAEVEGVGKLLADRAGYKSGESGSIAELLRAVAGQADMPLSPEQQLSLLADLERSIDSLDETMRGSGIS
jgi:hypothetical protein